MLARLAGNLFWMSRYLERIEGTARLLNVHDNLLMDLPQADLQYAWAPLVSITGMDDIFYRHYESPSEHNVVAFLISDQRNPSSIINALGAIRDNLRGSRDTISRSLYEAINNLCLTARSQIATGIDTKQRRRFLKTLEEQILSIAGTMEGSMSRNQSLLFLKMGAYLERADMTSRILDVRSANLLPATDDTPLLPFENRQWVAVLRSVSAMQMYLTQMRKPVNGPDVLAYLLKDTRHPRAYLCCLMALDQCLQQLSRNYTPMRRLRRLEREVEHADIISLANDKTQLHDFIDELQLKLAHAGNGLADAYFPS